MLEPSGDRPSEDGVEQESTLAPTIGILRSMTRKVEEKGQPGEVRVWAETERFYPRRAFEVDKARHTRGDVARRLTRFREAVDGIGEVVKDLADDGWHLRPQGARWSFSAVAATSPTEDVLWGLVAHATQLVAKAG